MNFKICHASVDSHNFKNCHANVDWHNFKNCHASEGWHPDQLIKNSLPRTGVTH